jgi:hypothetical protein
MAKRKAAEGQKIREGGTETGGRSPFWPRVAHVKRTVKRQGICQKEGSGQESQQKRPRSKSTARKKAERTHSLEAREAPPELNRNPREGPPPRSRPSYPRGRRTAFDPLVTGPRPAVDRPCGPDAPEAAQNIREHHGMDGVTGGDPDVDIEDAYFRRREAPGGDNPTPDQDIVEDIGKALGVTYNDNEELKGADKLVERDKHRWEMDPAQPRTITSTIRTRAGGLSAKG